MSNLEKHKNEQVDKIFEHITKCYQPESGTGKIVRKALVEKLSINEVASLQLMIATSAGRE